MLLLSPIISYLTLICIHRYLPCYTYYLISDTGTCHAMLITWYLIPVLAMLYLSLDIWHRYLPCLSLDIWHRYLPCYTYRLIPDTWYNNTWHLTCYHPVLIHLTWYCGTYIILHIHDYYFYGDLAFLLYCYQIFGTPELMCSWTPVFLNPCNRETPDIILLILHSC